MNFDNFVFKITESPIKQIIPNLEDWPIEFDNQEIENSVKFSKFLND
jgi:pterin-4a-carbinolamine dehydratase